VGQTLHRRIEKASVSMIVERIRHSSLARVLWPEHEFICIRSYHGLKLASLAAFERTGSRFDGRCRLVTPVLLLPVSILREVVIV
jgi:hypothetical protein